MNPWLDDGDVRLAYLAGIVDGEGYIGIKRTGRKYHARLQVGMCELGAITLLRETFGGSLHLEKRHRPIHRWHTTDLQTERALAALLPYLRVKRSQAEAVLEFRRLQAESRQHRTKIVGHRDFPNQYGTVRLVPTTALSDEYVEMCHQHYLRLRRLNATGGDAKYGAVA